MEKLIDEANKELLNVSTIRKNNLEQSKFRLLNNFVFYFNRNLEKSAVDLFVENNFEHYHNTFQSINKTFVIVNNQSVSESEINTLKYYFPSLNVDNLDFNPSQSLFDYLGYTGTIQTGVIIQSDNYNYKDEICIVEINHSESLQNVKLFFESLFNHLKENKGFVFEPIKRELVLCSPINRIKETDEGENIDDETKEQVELVLKKLREIRDKGNFIALLPLLEKHLLDQNQNNTKLSHLHIDQDYKIWLTYYNLEVKLSHLTKSLYLLFLAMEHGIHLDELIDFKKELTTIYRSVSNQENNEKMIQSINLLLQDKNAIYVHISRIKAVFLKLVQEDIAKEYYITGYKYQPKSIALERKLTNVNDFLLQWNLETKSKYKSKYAIDLDFHEDNPF